MSILSWLKGAIGSLFNKSEAAEKFQINISADKSMDEAVRLWAECYRNTPPWMIADSSIHSLNLPYSIAHEVARLVTLEFKSELTGSARAEYLSPVYNKLIGDSPVWTEYACALGGVFLKPYVADGHIVTDYVQADAAIVTDHDSGGNITGCIFADRITKDKKYYTRLEQHRLSGTMYTVVNKAYVSDSPSQLGREISLDSVPEWSGIAPSAGFKNIKRPLFVYFGMPGANIIDRRSPLGVSVFNGAIQTIEDADRQFTRGIWEFEGSELAVYVDTTAIIKHDGQEDVPRFNRRLIKTLDFGGANDKAFNVFSPNIREQSHINGLNHLLRQIERQCGLAFGTLSDVQDVDKTATEIKSSKQRSYTTISAIQDKLQETLKKYAEVLDILCTLYGLCPTGALEQSFEFDDSLVTDSETEQKIWLQEVGAGLMRPETYLMKRYGYTEEQALEMLPQSIEGDI